MLRPPRQGLLGLLLGIASTLAVFVTAVGASADNGGDGGTNNGIWGSVECDQSPSPGCSLGSGTTGDAGSSAAAGSGGSGRVAPVPLGCVYRRVAFVPPVGAIARPGGSGAWFVSVCAGARGSVVYPPVWIAAGRAGPSPEALARAAYGRLRLPVPVIVVSPVGDQLVYLPTWLAVSGGSWGLRSASASVPGVSVTATASPVRVVWSLGDGSTVVCAGPGSVYSASVSPGAVSPTCGHTYQHASSARPGGVYRLTATVQWTVTWSGAGRHGVFPGLATTSLRLVRVREAPAVNVP